jgi:hypothetical protein
VPIGYIFVTPIPTTAIEKRRYITKYQFNVAKSTPKNIKVGAILSIITIIINLESH